MEVLNISIDRPKALPPTIAMAILFLMTKVLKCLRVMEDVYISILIQSTRPLEIVELTLILMMVEAYIGFKRTANLPLVVKAVYHSGDQSGDYVGMI